MSATSAAVRMFYVRLGNMIKESRKQSPKNKKSNAGFTLLELLVVIAIIGMLTSFIFVQLTSFRANSRDATREESIKQIQNALALYHVTHLLYPPCAEVVLNGSTDCLSSALIGDGVFSASPVDPLGRGTGAPPCGPANPNLFEFCYESATGADYSILYHLETSSIQGKNAGWQPPVVP